MFVAYGATAARAVVRRPGRGRDDGLAAAGHRAGRADPAGPALWPAVAAAAFVVNADDRDPALGRGDHRRGQHPRGGGAARACCGGSASTAVWQRLRDVLAAGRGRGAREHVDQRDLRRGRRCARRAVQPAESYAAFWAVWWVGDAMGDLLIAPLICVWATPLGCRVARCGWLERPLLAVALTAVSAMVFHRPYTTRAIELIRGTYAIVPLADLGGAALRTARAPRRRCCWCGARRDRGVGTRQLLRGPHRRTSGC